MFRATQALTGSHPQAGITVASEFTGNAVQYVHTDRAMHRQVLYSNNETPFRSNMMCSNGVAGIDNTCLCPGSASAVPYTQNPAQYESMYMTSLFSPVGDTFFPQPTMASRKVMAERGPMPSSYRTMELIPLNQ
jgi:hypothetical protein